MTASEALRILDLMSLPERYRLDTLGYQWLLDDDRMSRLSNYGGQS